MEINLSASVEGRETLSVPIAIAFTPREARRYADLRKRLKKINKSAKMSTFARRALIEMMGKVEAAIEKYEG